MAYEKHTWECGEEITAQKLNHMEEGIANAGGGGCDCGFECTEATTLLTEETVTTTKMGESSPSASALLSYSTPIDADEIKLTLNGTEYVLQRQERSGGYNFYVGENEYPTIHSSAHNGNALNTQEAGTYSLKIEVSSLSVETTPCFKEAVKSLIPPAPVFIAVFDKSGDTIVALTPYASVRQADLDGKYIVARIGRINETNETNGTLVRIEDEYGIPNYRFGFLSPSSNPGSPLAVQYIDVLLKFNDTVTSEIKQLAFTN